MLTESKASRLAISLQEHIDKGNLSAGTFLGTKAALLEQHEVAAGTLNEALRLLQVRGYIEVKPGPKGGAFVASKARRSKLTESLLSAQEDPSQAETYIQLQDALESLIVVTSASQCKPEDRPSIQAALERLEIAEGPDEILAGVWDVDRAVARATHNPILTNIYIGIIDALQAATKRFSVPRDITESTRDVHRQIAEAVLANDLQAAKEAAFRHSPTKEDSESLTS